MTGLTRRRVLVLGLAPAVLAGAGFGGAELVSRGVLPGRNVLDTLDGACSVPVPAPAYAPLGPSFSGTFYSAARRRPVGYTIAYPPSHRPGAELPLVVALHGLGGSHADALAGMSPAQAVALTAGGRPLAPMALVTVDGGGGYWNPHPGDDPMAMVIRELIPRCQRLGLGRPPRRIATLGISMGGYGALLFAEKFPRLIAAAAAISPAIWTSYAQARQANPGAYASAAAFAVGDAVTHAAALARRPVRIASGYADPFYPRRPGTRPRPAGRGGAGFRAWLSRRVVLRRPGTAFAGLPGPPPVRLTSPLPRPAPTSRSPWPRPPSGFHHRHTAIPRPRRRNQPWHG